MSGYVEKPNTIYHVGISGGKDSVAALLYLVHEAKIPPEKIDATFCDTMNEHKWTYEHVKLISRTVHPIKRLKPPRGFMALALWRHRFPDPKRRFCTQLLKIFPSQDHIQTLLDAGKDVVAVSGVRAEESEERSKLTEWGSWMEGALPAPQWRPLIHWTFAQVVALHQKHGVPLNPLYAIGAQRVGCFPCIMSRKAEIRNIALRFPERIDAIRRAEAKMLETLGVVRMFFPIKMVPARFRSTPYTCKDGRKKFVATIDDVVRWSMTGRRARGSYKDDEAILFDNAGETVCNAGMCE